MDKAKDLIEKECEVTKSKVFEGSDQGYEDTCLNSCTRIPSIDEDYFNSLTLYPRII